MKRRQFIKGAVAVAVGAALPLSGRAHRSHAWSAESDMCLVCRMTMQMVQETGRIECPGTALYDYRHVTYRTEWVFSKETVAGLGERYSEMLAHSMQQTKEVVVANVFNKAFGG